MSLANAMHQPERSKPIRMRPMPAKNSAKFIVFVSLILSLGDAAVSGSQPQLRFDSGRNGNCRCEGMFPYPQDAPALLGKRFCRLPITHSVSADFVLPIRSVLLRDAAVPPAPMPKTAIHKHGQSFAWESEIRFAM
jgi:hypothetical protein